MSLSPKAAGVVRGLVIVLLAGMAAGVLYVALSGPLEPADVARGVIAGALIFVPIYLFDVAAANAGWGKRLRQRPFLVAIGLRTLVYLVFIVVGLLVAAFATGVPLSDATGILGGTHIAFAFLVAFVFSTIRQLSRMLGPSVLTSFVTGRYHRPRLEERVFLFMDLVDSTTTAERLGPLRFHALLDRIAFDVADAIATYHGEIHRYVGDEIIVTWMADKGLRDAACIRAAFSMVSGVDRRASRYLGDFGVKPAFHIAMHVGPVVVGEMGDLHREIVFLGDTVNTTARIEAASGAMGRSVLVSQELMDRLGTIPAEVAMESIGSIALRGKQDPIPLVSLTWRPAERPS